MTSAAKPDPAGLAADPAAAESRSPAAIPTRPPTFGEALRFWFKLGWISFGGPTGQIAIMHTELVEKLRWISERRFLHALNYCMLLPGPEAQQLATYVGWLLHGTRGGIAAGTLFVLPSVAILWGLSYLYVAYGHLAWLAAVFAGLKPAVMAIVAAAVIRIGSKVLRTQAMWALAGAAFVAIFVLGAPFPVIVLAAGVAGWFGGRIAPRQFVVLKAKSGLPAGDDAVLGDDHAPPAHARRSSGRALRVLVTGLVLWWTPVLVAAAWLGPQHAATRAGVFFSQAALMTFGGAYAVLPYVAQQAVERFGWLGPGQMLDGLGLAETTPGPLIMVVQFVGFLAGWGQPGALSPLAAATVTALLTTWVTFVPCFLWIFLGAPYIEHLRASDRLGATLSAITAAVVGVVLNLAVWFAWHVLRPTPGEFDVFAALLAGAAFAAMVRWRWGVIPVVAAAAFIGLARWAAGLAG